MTTCAATTKSGKPCKNNSRDESAYCYAHRNFVSAEAPAAAEPVTEIPVIEEVETPTSTGEGFERIVDDLNGIADQIKERVPNFIPPAFSPERLTELLKENVDRFGSDSELVKDLQEQLDGKTAQDFLEPETWSGLWHVLNYSLNKRSESLRVTVSETVSEQMEALKNSEALADFQKNVNIESPQDLLSADTWKNVFLIANDTLQTQATALRERIRNQSNNNDSA